MSFPTGSSNPYAPPAVDLSSGALAEDTEFLFNDKVVAGVGRISLPDICVVSGERDNLIRRDTTLRLCGRWLTILRSILIGLAIVSLAQLIPIGPAPPGGRGVFYRLPVIVGTGSIIGVACCSMLGRLLGQTITVTWSISGRVVRKVRWIWIAGVSAIPGIIILVDLPLSLGQDYWVFYATMAAFVGGNTLSFASAAGYRPLKILGKHDGLLLIGGFRVPFLKEIERLAALRSSRESGTVSKPD